MHDIFLTQRELSARYHVSNRTLERRRGTGDGPAFVRVGPRRVPHRPSDREAWAAARTCACRAAGMAQGARSAHG